MTMLIQNSILQDASQVFLDEIEALRQVQARLDFQFEKAIALLLNCRGRVIVSGMGKSGLIGRKIAATFSSTGTPAFFLHPGEGVHGDLGMMAPGDIVIALSNSGETPELLQVLPVIRHLNLPLIGMTGNLKSSLAKRCDVVLDTSVSQEACPLNLAPTSSTTTTLVMGDALAVVLMSQKGFSETDFAIYHPAGSLGKRLLLTVEDVMHQGQDLPKVMLETSFKSALLEMTSKKLGMTLVVDNTGKTLGIVTDGDIRRVLTREQDIQHLKVQDIYTSNPKSISKTALAAEALALMEQHQITVLPVNTTNGHSEGIVHLHDLLKTGI